MKNWHTVTKEELFNEVAPGVIFSNTDLIDKLNWAEYLPHIRDMIGFGMNLNRELTAEHVEDVLDDIFMQEFHLMYDRWPEPDEIAENRKQEYTQRTKEALIQLTMSHTSETWPEFEKQMIEHLGLETE